MKCFHRTMATLAWGLVVAFMAQPVLAKEKIESITDLPVRSYPTQVAPSQMLGDPALMDALRMQVRIDIEGILSRYDLEDAATLRRFYGVLSTIALLEARDNDAALNWERVRELEEKDAAKYMTGLNGASLVAARNSGEPGSEVRYASARSGVLADSVQSAAPPYHRKGCQRSRIPRGRSRGML